MNTNTFTIKTGCDLAASPLFPNLSLQSLTRRGTVTCRVRLTETQTLKRAKTFIKYFISLVTLATSLTTVMVLIALLA